MFLANQEKLDIFKKSIDNNKTRFKPMLPTRWAVRCQAISTVLNNSLDIINALEHFTMASVNISE